jgi:hypothetical protein
MMPSLSQMTPKQIEDLVRGIEVRGFGIPVSIMALTSQWPCIGISVTIQIISREDGLPGYINESRFHTCYSDFSHAAISVPSQLIRAIYKQISELVMHELAECFYVDGKRIYDPHDDSRMVITR